MRAIRRSAPFNALLALGPAVAIAQSTPPIEDNSFLVEEAYNQERGIVQHISTWQHAPLGRAWAYTFTQEWPAPTIKNQLSYTIPIVRTDIPDASPRLGDIALNYRRQLHDDDGVYFAPRLTLLIPTGSASEGSGTGGLGYQGNLPLTLELSRFVSTHTNVGGTIIPRGETDEGDRLRLANLTLAQSVIVMPSATFNLMLETVWSRTTSRIAGVDAPRDQWTTISPGARYAFNFSSGLQIVPGLAFPITVRGHRGSTNANTGVFAYLSFEHPFRKHP
jgi:hypothetical protein